MFSGIVEARARAIKVEGDANLLRVVLERPAAFSDLNPGDSISTDGVCLTVEEFTDQEMQFALGAETLRVTGWTRDKLFGRVFNLERSLRFGDRVHGHFVSGHVDAVGHVTSVRDLGGSRELDILVPETLSAFLWQKGSWAINGVSLTINKIEGRTVTVCLIPETLERTNLQELRAGDIVNLESDQWARGLVHFLVQSRSGSLPTEMVEEVGP